MGKDLKGKELGKGISQRADGRYIARFTSKTGKRKTLYDFKLNELKRKLREAVYEDEHGLNGNGESITLNAWYVTWTELYKKKTVKMTTIYKNHSYYNARVKNSIGKMYLQDIKTYHVQKFINELIDSGLAHGTVSNIRFMLSDMFDKAVLSEYIRKNPCIAVEMPPKVKKERRVLTREEQKKFFTFASSYIHINVLKFAVTTGCRIGEILGLKFQDFDFEKQTVRISRQLVGNLKLKEKEFTVTEYAVIERNPKTENSYRILRVPKVVMREVKRRQQLIELRKTDLGIEYKNFDYVCCQENGEPRSLTAMNQALTKICNRNGLPNITVHGLRHMFATILIELGVPLFKISGLLGHSSVHTTYEYYCEIMDEQDKIIAFVNNTFVPQQNGTEG